MATGLEDLESLREAGFNEQEVEDHRNQVSNDLLEAGFTDKEIGQHWGEKFPDMSNTEKYYKDNLAKAAQAKKEESQKQIDKPVQAKTETKTGTSQKVEGQTGATGSWEDIPGSGATGSFAPEPTDAEVADSFAEYFEAGFDISVTGLISARPDMVLPEDQELHMRIISQIGTLAGDLPFMFAGSLVGAPVGGVAGAAAGTAVAPGPGTLVGATIGSAVVGAGAAFAVPAGMREVLMQQYEKGDVESFDDFWGRTSAAFIESRNAFLIGAATGGVGKLVGIAGKTLGTGVRTTAEVAAEVTTMTTVGAALRGEMPEPEEFLDAAILIGGLRGVGALTSKTTGRLQTKLMNLYAKKGMKPGDAYNVSRTDPKFHQELISKNVELPQGNQPVTHDVLMLKPPSEFLVSKPLPNFKGELSPEVQNVLSKVGTKKTKADLNFGSFREFYRNFVDKLDAVNQTTKIAQKAGVELLANENPHISSRTVSDSNAKALVFFEKHTFDAKTKKANGKGLNEILKDAESLEILEAYMISKKVIEKSAQGKKTGFDVGNATKVVGENAFKYEKVAREVTEYSNRVLKYAFDSGVISKKQFQSMMEMNKDYVPFKRLIEIAEDGTVKIKGTKAGSLKEFKGSERDIQSPITSIVENTIELLRMSEVNKAKIDFVRMAEKMEAKDVTGVLERVKTPVKPFTIKKADLAKKLNISESQLKDITVFTSMGKDLAKNQFDVLMEGSRVVFETSPGIAEALAKLGGDRGSTNVGWQLARGVTKFKKHTITFTPDFIARNFFRDMLTASVFSAKGGVNPVEVFSAMRDIMGKGDAYWNWMKSGGANGAFIELGDAYVKGNVRQLQNQTGFMNSVHNIAKKPIDMMRLAATLSEQGVRLAEFKKVTEGRTDAAALAEGGFSAREITLDFQRMGAKMSALNSITAFQNVSIQGLDKTIRAVEANPKAVMTRGMIALTAPSMMLWWANRDDERYKELPGWEKVAFWHIVTDDWQESEPEEANDIGEHLVRRHSGKTFINRGTIWRLPKPMELGLIFGTLPVMVATKYFDDNPDAFASFNEGMINMLSPSILPDVARPMVEQAFNHSFFKGGDIVPAHMEPLKNHYEYKTYTSETAKALGKMMFKIAPEVSISSPLIIENYIQSWSGALGKYFVQVVDEGLRKAGVAEDITKPSLTLADIPFVKSFVSRYPSAGSASIDLFYRNLAKTETVSKTIQELKKRGDFDNLMMELELPENQKFNVNLKQVSATLAKMRNSISGIYANPNMSRSDKRQLIDNIMFQMTASAKLGNEIVRMNGEIIDEIEKDKKLKKKADRIKLIIQEK